MKKITRYAILGASLVAPLIAAAQGNIPTGINESLIARYSTGIINVINGVIVPVLLAIAFIVFIWGVYKYFILGAADEKSRTDGRQFVLWGIIGFVVLFSVWGLVSIVRGAFGLETGSSPRPPTFNTSDTSASGSTNSSSYFFGGGEP
ncbi:MAG: hypothetical protein PHD04_02725 [Candidatus Pacebacteria bacterium]|nr:hypothetical protein [Candidatus Paceibacterota bacterium]